MRTDWEQTVDKVGRILARDYGIHVICRGSEAKTDGTTIYIPSIPDNASDELRGAIRGFLDHEVGHIIGDLDRKSFKKLKKFCLGFSDEEKAKAKMILNVVEDVRIENLMESIYVGSKVNLGNCNALCNKKAREGAEKGNAMSPLKAISYAFFDEARGHERLDFIPKESYDAVNVLLKDELERARNAKTVDESIEIADSIIQKLKEQSNGSPGDSGENDDTNDGEGEAQGGPPNENGQGDNNEPGGDDGGTPGTPDQQNGPADQHGDSSETHGEGHGDNQPSGQEDGGSGRSEQLGSTEADTGSRHDSQDGVQFFDGGGLNEDDARNIGEAIRDEMQAQGQGQEQDGYLQFMPENDGIIRDLMLPDLVKKRKGNWGMRAFRKSISGMKSQFRTLILSQKRSAWRRNQDVGEVDTDSLTKLVQKNGDARIFKALKREKAPDTAIILLVDQSISMKGDCERFATLTALNMSLMLEDLNIKNAVIGFMDSDRHPDDAKKMAFRQAARNSCSIDPYFSNRYRMEPMCINIAKDFHHRARRRQDYILSMVSDSNTPMVEGLFHCGRIMEGMREERRIVIAMTDGQPNSTCKDGSQVRKQCRKTVTQLAHRGIETYMISLGCSGIKRCHPDDSCVSVVTDESQVGKQVLKDLSKALARRAG